MFRQQEFVFPALCVNNAVSTMCDYWVNENTISQIIRQNNVKSEGGTVKENDSEC